MSRQVHPYHLVDGSPWPILMAFALLGFAVSIIGILIISIQWWRDVIREAKGGYHTITITEIMLFGSFFWSFFHASLSPAIDLGSTWPPMGINAVNTWAIPLLGTCVL
ncbi:Cytochrome c oxidase subunit 3 [Clydaea vesicula]|uniref:Cytochrome c oxidase subunit 3 n=1 Tax=Clydaea vesicula TaxID=447962 RepID=A0AAD5XWY9_9FUNG|nr:Cytochrome c oxidase subunit 3 [Clydaea vesicula]KAJ3389602.1 Cytochrome c oxidase subunit 3 [Lobulomyces angularis]